MKRRFTIDGSDQLEQRLHDLCEQVSQEVRRIIPQNKLDGLVAAGGYGRGEGGVLRTEKGDAPYNDLEFYAFAKGNLFLNDRKYRARLDELGERLSPAAGLHVEFKILSLKKLQQSAVTMFYYDLVSGHRVCLGDEAILSSCEHHRAAHRIPLSEATRLLMNRCSGLLFAREQLEALSFGSENSDFVGRNIAKAQLAMGDVILAAYGQYHSSCRERHRRLHKLAELEETNWVKPFVDPHALGVEFKLHPRQSIETREQLAERHAAVAALAGQLWLWLENRRLGHHYKTLEGYTFCHFNKAPETDGLRNIAVNAKAFGFSTCVRSGSSRYPRERLLNTLPLLLWSEDPLRRPEIRQRVETQLRAECNSLPDAVAAYRQIWNRFN